MTPELMQRIDEWSLRTRPPIPPAYYPCTTEALVDDLIAALKKADAVAKVAEWCREHLADVIFHPTECEVVIYDTTTFTETDREYAPALPAAVDALRERLEGGS